MILGDNSASRSQIPAWELRRKRCREFSTRSNKAVGRNWEGWVSDSRLAKHLWKHTKERSPRKVQAAIKERHSRWYFRPVNKLKRSSLRPFHQWPRSASACAFCLSKITKILTVHLRIYFGGAVIMCNQH